MRAHPERHRASVSHRARLRRARFREARGSRAFDVLLEGKTEVRAIEPFAAGFGVPTVIERAVEVIDGALDIDFAVRIENPKISAIEVIRLGGPGRRSGGSR